MNLSKTKFVLFLSFKLLIFISLALFADGCKVREKPAGLKEKLISLCKEIPPDFSQFGSPDSFIKDDRGTYGLSFESSLDYDAVKSYYSEKLPPNEWKILERTSNNISSGDKVRYLSFSNDGYSIHLETLGYSRSGEKITYLVNCSWNAY